MNSYNSVAHQIWEGLLANWTDRPYGNYREKLNIGAVNNNVDVIRYLLPMFMFWIYVCTYLHKKLVH